MNAIMQAVILILIVVAILAFFYKVYLQVIIENPAKKGKYIYAVVRFMNFADFLPLGVRNKNGEELELRKKANKALFVFYGSLIIGFILIAIFM